MVVPRTRTDLIAQLEHSYRRLVDELQGGGQQIADLPCTKNCTENRTVHQLLAVRAWWTKSTAQWIVCGLRGKVPAIPSEGYRWSETPQLNADIAMRAIERSYQSVRKDLDRWFKRVRALIDELDDAQLLEAFVFEWAAKWPVCRWISINTIRQYATARTFIRRAKK